MLGGGGLGMFIRCIFRLLMGTNYLGWSLRWRKWFFFLVFFLVSVAWLVVFLLVAGVVEAEVFVFLVWGSWF